MSAALDRLSNASGFNDVSTYEGFLNELKEIYPANSNSITHNGKAVTQSLISFARIKIEKLSSQSQNEVNNELESWSQSLEMATSNNPDFIELFFNVNKEGNRLKNNRDTEEEGLALLALAIDYKFSRKNIR